VGKYNPKFVIDAGGNIGLTALYFSKKYPNATIITIEPDHSNYELIVKNIKSVPKIHSFKKALWYNCNGIYLNSIGANDSFFLSSEESICSQFIETIDVLSIISMFKIKKIDLFKIDIEGAELELFSNNNGWLSNVDCLIIELHDRFKPGCSMHFFRALTNYTLAIKGELLKIDFNK